MEFLYRNATPGYKGIQPQQASTAFPSGIMNCLFASGTPCYRTANGNGASAPATARSWWQTWNPTPVYRTMPAACVDASNVSPDADGAADSACGCVTVSDQAPQVMIL